MTAIAASLAPTSGPLLIGDSVIWGHYVASEETLSHYLNEAAGGPKFANLGVDGIHPIAMSGLLEYYGTPIVSKDVILQCNLLWMSSPRHDLRTDKAFSFNHPKLVPQFYPRIPCYAEPLSGRIGIAIGRHVPFLGWTDHLRIAYFGNTDLPNWTMEHPYEDPLRAITLELPSAERNPVAQADRQALDQDRDCQAQRGMGRTGRLAAMAVLPPRRGDSATPRESGVRAGRPLQRTHAYP